MKYSFNRCGNSGGDHSLIVAGWIITPKSKVAAHYLCEKCFKLFDHQEIASFHTEHHKIDSETSLVGSVQV